MGFSKDNYMVVNPGPQTSQWLQFIEDLLPWATIFGLVFKAIEMVFKYFSQAQDARLRGIIQQEVKPDITNLTTAINELRESIWELKAAKSK